jgi:hypothetical protein
VVRAVITRKPLSLVSARTTQSAGGSMIELRLL